MDGSGHARLRRLQTGAYYSIERVDALFNAGVLPVIPPPSLAVVHGKDNIDAPCRTKPIPIT